MAYQAAGRLNEALPPPGETLKLRKATLGTDHPSALNSVNSLAEAFLDAKRSTEAATTLRECVSLRERNSPTTGGELGDLRAQPASALHAVAGQRRFAEADRSSSRGMKASVTATKMAAKYQKHLTRAAGERILSLYDASGQKSQGRGMAKTTRADQRAGSPKTVRRRYRVLTRFDATARKRLSGSRPLPAPVTPACCCGDGGVAVRIGDHDLTAKVPFLVYVWVPMTSHIPVAVLNAMLPADLVPSPQSITAVKSVAWVKSADVNEATAPVNLWFWSAVRVRPVAVSRGSLSTMVRARRGRAAQRPAGGVAEGQVHGLIEAFGHGVAR